MWRRLSLLILCCALRAHGALEEANGSADSFLEKMLLDEKEKLDTFSEAKDASTAGQVENSQRGEEQQPAPGRDAPTAGTVPKTTVAPLEDEQDNQENIISQLLGDYDKVKTVSSGSDCVCRCVVRPIKRSDCNRIHDSDPASLSQEFYTVETITKGTDCKKCVCMAPPTAVNPCEGEYRFKKLQEASKDDIKLATIIDLLEGSMYGLDLLKLQSVTTKLLTRMDNMEKAFTRNLTERAREKERAKDKVKDKDKDKKAQQKKKKTNDLECGGGKKGAGVLTIKQKTNENQLKKKQQHDGLEQQPQNKNTTAAQSPIKEKTEPRQPIKDKNNMVIRGVTFYKAEEERFTEDEEDRKTRGKDTTVTTKASVDLLISDQVPPTQPLGPVAGEPNDNIVSTTFKPTTPTTNSPQTTEGTNAPPSTVQPTALPTTTAPTPTTTKRTTTSQLTTTPTTTPPPTTTTPPPTTTTPPPTTTTPPPTTTTPPPTTPASKQTTLLSDTNVGTPTEAFPTAAPQPKPRSRISWTESPADQPKTTKKPGLCKDTVASLSEPVQQNSYGLSDGAWMRDARGHGNVIYLTNGHYGNILQEFRDLDTFKLGQPSNSYKLPYSFTGTGHVVFNGAFYYNRAFSRDIIRYDLRHRFVAAWTTLHDALLEEEAHRTQSEVEFAVDESGLWLLYPALDSEGFHQEVILLVHLDHRELRTIRSFRTGLRRSRYGNSFLVCGVLYGVDSMERLYANVTYAFDTHTFTHTVPSLAFTNMHGHTSQLSYCPLDKKLYAWDNGHQMTYDVIFAY